MRLWPRTQSVHSTGYVAYAHIILCEAEVIPCVDTSLDWATNEILLSVAVRAPSGVSNSTMQSAREPTASINY